MVGLACVMLSSRGVVFHFSIETLPKDVSSLIGQAKGATHADNDTPSSSSDRVGSSINQAPGPKYAERAGFRCAAQPRDAHGSTPRLARWALELPGSLPLVESLLQSSRTER